MNKEKKNWLTDDGVQTLIASLICIILGLAIGFLVLLIINAAGAGKAIGAIMKNYMNYQNTQVAMQYFGSTLVKAAPLLMCSLSILFAYKVGLFNIGASGQYTVGAGVALYLGIALQLPWWICLIGAIIGGAIMGAISGALTAYRNVNIVIGCIMLNWISLYAVNMLLLKVKEPATTNTQVLASFAPKALLPKMGLHHLFSDNKYVTIAIPLSVIIAIAVMVVLDKTKLGYELKATGLNKNAAKYAGMREKKNTVLTMAISGGLAGAGAAFYFLSGIEQWSCSQTSVPAMGFNGISAAFLGGLNPIGAIFSSYFIQHITSGGSFIDTKIYSTQISDLISSIIIYLCGFVLFFKVCMNAIIRKKAENAQKGGQA